MKTIKVYILVYAILFVILSIFLVPMKKTAYFYGDGEKHSLPLGVNYMPIFKSIEVDNEAKDYGARAYFEFNIDKTRLNHELLSLTVVFISLISVSYINIKKNGHT